MVFKSMKIKIAKNDNYSYSFEYTKEEQKRLSDWAIYVEAFATTESDNLRTSSSMMLQIRNAALIKDVSGLPSALENLFSRIESWRNQIRKVADARQDIPPQEKERFVKIQLALKIQEVLTSNSELRDALFTHIYELSDKIAHSPNYLQIPPGFSAEDAVAYMIRNTMDLDKTAALSDNANRGKMSSSIVDWLAAYAPEASGGTKNWESYIAPLLRQKGKNAVSVWNKGNKGEEALEYEGSDGKTTENANIYQNRQQDPHALVDVKPVNLSAWTKEMFNSVRNLVMKLANKNPEKYEVLAEKFGTYTEAMNTVVAQAKKIDQMQIGYFQDKNPETLKQIQNAVQIFQTSFMKAHEIFPNTSKGFADELADILEDFIPQAPVAEEVVNPQTGETEVAPQVGETEEKTDDLAWIEQHAPDLARKLLSIGGKPGVYVENGSTKPYSKMLGQQGPEGQPVMKYYIGLSKLLHLGINSIGDLSDLLDETRSLSSQNYEAIISHLITQAGFYESRYRAVMLSKLSSPSQYKPIFGKFLFDLIAQFGDKYYAYAVKAAEESGELAQNPQATQAIQAAKDTLITNLRSAAKARLGGKKELDDSQVENMTQANDVFRGLLSSIDPSMRAAAYEFFKDEIAKRRQEKLEWGGNFGGTALTQEDLEEIANEVFQKVYLNGKVDMSLRSKGKNPYEPAKGLSFLQPHVIKQELQKLNTPGTKGDSWMMGMDDLTKETRKTPEATVRVKLKRCASKEELNDLAAYYDTISNYEFADKVDRLIFKWYAND